MKTKYDLNLEEGVDFKVKECHWLPRKMNVDYFVFRKTMYCRNHKVDLPRHEFLHLAQFKKYGTIIVILHYVYFIIKNLIKYRMFSTAFQEIPFEVEARKFASQNGGE